MQLEISTSCKTHVHNSLSLIPILNQINLIHTLSTCQLKIHFTPIYAYVFKFTLS
jgi:hypothetical protein